MATDPEIEYRRVMETYPLLGRRDLTWLGVLLGVLVGQIVVSGFIWSYWIAVGISFLGWETTKWRLRRAARKYAEIPG